MSVKYGPDHKANPGYLADPAKIAALKAKTDAINVAKGRKPAEKTDKK